MTTTPIKHGNVIPSKMVSGLDAVWVVREIVATANHWIDVHETEVTKRSVIAAREHTLIEEIHARRDLFLTYLDRSFDEREMNFTELFRALDRALASDSASVASVLASITALAAKSPFADLVDIDLVKQNLADPNYLWTA
jgi:hypothetical protein